MLMLKCTLTILILFVINGIVAEKHCPPQDTILPCRCLVKLGEYQIWCSHSDLPRVLDGLKAIAQQITEPIDELILENNYLPSLPGRTFVPLKVLRLMLRHNGLERVSSDWLTGLDKHLMEIFLVEPQLRSLPDDSLQNLNTLQAVTIQTKLMKRLPLFSGLPKLRYLQVESESLLEVSSSNFKDNPSLEKIHIASSPRLQRLEANLFRDLPKLELINITNCGLNWIHPRALVRLPALKELLFIGNKITDAGMIGRGTQDLPQLEIIRLDHNYIDRIAEASFVNLSAVKHISLSNNRITEIQHGAFHKVPSLRTLNFNRNIIQRIHPESFLIASSSGVEELLLSENDISYIEELKAILNALPRLTFLDMSFNNLEAIPFGALRGHATLEHLNLDYNKLHLIDKEAFMAMPALRELRLKNNSLSDLLEPPFWNLPALKGLDLSGNFFKKLEPTIFANLPALRRLDVSGNLLSAIDPASFLPSPSLEHINISYNHLKFVHPGTFRNLLHLYELDVSYNQLLEFVPGLPREIERLYIHHNQLVGIPKIPSPDVDLPSLRVLDLGYNRIEYIPKMSMSTLPQLRRLYLGNNFIHNLDQKALEGLARLETLDLRNNRLVEIHPQSLQNLVQLKEVNLENNRLDLLPPKLFQRNPLLQRFDISGNQIGEILSETLENNLNVQILDASNNVLVKFPKTLYGLRNLKKLDLTNNRIKDIDREVLNSLINIKDLKLSKNFIQELKEGVFSNLQHLKILEMDNNELNYIEPNAVQLLPSLKLVKITKNQIKEIPDLAFNTLPSLQVVELQENDIRIVAPSAFNDVPRLLMLNLSHNQIISMEDAGLANLDYLEVLDLSFNRIPKLSTSSMEKMEWLVELRMDNNELCKIQGSGFNDMPRLRVISLRNNKMMSFPEKSVQRLRGNIGVLDIDGNPLACVCSMLWLQAWLQESSQPGPRCIDGALLREMRLSREACTEEDRGRDIVAPGCDAELLTYPGTQGNLQALERWASLKNATKESLTNKNSLAPTPEESDYFYEDYVDYPYNETLVPNGQLGDKLKGNEHKNPHQLGDTPTLYAAPKNKTKIIPQKIPNSPSSSGFTFFGVPLPNLNSLFGGGVGRKDDKTPSYPAQRKTAIVNEPHKTNQRISMGNIQSDLAHMNKPRPEIHRLETMQPPKSPEFQGGFVPMLPGSGGFKPIPNPSLPPALPPKIPVDIIETSTMIHTENPQKRHNTNLLPQIPIQNDNPETLPLNIPSDNPEVETLSLNHLQTSDNNESSIRNTTKKVFSVEKETHLKSEISVITGTTSNSSHGPTIEQVYIEEITEPPKELVLPTETINIERETETEKIIETTTTVPIITTEEIIETTTPKIETTSFVPTTQTSYLDQKRVESAVEKLTATPLSTFLVPNGQQPQSKMHAKSTITKVASPNFKTEPVLAVPLPHREGKTNQGFISNNVENGSSIIGEESKDWYFANYNKTNLEPYVAKIVNSSRNICDYRSHILLVVFSYFTIMFIV